MTDTSAGLASLNPRNLTIGEIKRYAALVPADKLPESWRLEIIKRHIDIRNI